jgi:hypothetical protein
MPLKKRLNEVWVKVRVRAWCNGTSQYYEKAAMNAAKEFIDELKQSKRTDGYETEIMQDGEFECPHCGETTPIEGQRHPWPHCCPEALAEVTAERMLKGNSNGTTGPT